MGRTEPQEGVEGMQVQVQVQVQAEVFKVLSSPHSYPTPHLHLCTQVEV